eukprot:NODE_857_length_3510_cov_0.508062.p1 type:complete len:774 gc:universal NODE_857_length_3510_cov_0.508062:19-2340(+)
MGLHGKCISKLYLYRSNSVASLSSVILNGFSTNSTSSELDELILNSSFSLDSLYFAYKTDKSLISWSIFSSNLISTFSKSSMVTGSASDRYKSSSDMKLNLTPMLRRCKHFDKNIFRSPYFDGEFKKASEYTIKSIGTIHEHLLKEKNPTKIVQSFDRLSDTFCNLLDGLECIRNIHPDENIRNNATNAFATVAPTMYALNSDKQILEKITESLEGVKGNAQMVAQSLEKDFKKAGAHLPDDIRAKVEALNNELQDVCAKFIQLGSESREKIIPVAKSDISGLESYLKDYIVEENNNLSLKINMHSGLILLSLSESEDLRKLAHLIVTNASSEQLSLFEQMIKIRYNIAKIQGFSSYTELTANDRYLKTTDDILGFLKGYDKANSSLVMPLIDEMKKITTPADWNTMYAMHKLHELKKIHVPFKNQRSPYTLESILKAANFSLEHLFGVTLQEINDDQDLLMHEKVRKFAVMHPRGLLGFIYFDLEARDGAQKLTEAAHFTIRCSRRVDWDKDLSFDSKAGKLWQNDNFAYGNFTDMQGLYQRPVVYLVTDFKSDDNLSFYEASTVMHELGHGMHTFLGISDYQMLSGTRCKHDIAEIPSIFLEKMIVNPYVLNHLFQIDINEARKSFGIDNGSVPSFESPVEILEDVWTSVVDQALHSDLIGKMNHTDYFTCAVVAGLADKRNNFAGQFSFQEIQKEALNTKYASFPHLTGYGSCYFSYLFARAVANKMHTKQNTFYSEPKEWLKNERLAEEFMTSGGYHKNEFLDKLVSKK